VLAFIGAVFFAWAVRPAAEAGGTAAPALVDVDNAPMANSIAVLPFENLSPDPDNAYMATGLHDEVLVRLDKFKSLAVIGRQSVMRYENSDLPSTQIGRELHVETVLESSVSYGNGRIAVRTRLVDAATGVVRWSEAYNRDFADVFAVQADIAMNIANALQAAFSSEEQARIEQVPTRSSEAYSLYLRAAALARGGDPRSLVLHERAAELDPKFADAHGAVAATLSQRLVSTTTGVSVTAETRADLESKLRRYADKAIELDPEQPNAHGALAMLALVHWHWTDAEAAFRRASASGKWSRSPVAVLYFGYLLSYTGRNDEAIAIAERARRLNPSDPYAGGLGFAHGMSGNYAAAADVWRAAQQNYLPIQSLWLAFADIARGNIEEARAQLDVVARATAGDAQQIVFLPELAYGFARAGRPEDARRVFEEMQDAANGGAPTGAGAWAMAYLAIGDQRSALEWLEIGAKSAENHEPDPSFINLLNLKMNITDDPTLKQPEFAAVFNRIRGD